jgi:hypothetical protein
VSALLVYGRGASVLPEVREAEALDLLSVEAYRCGPALVALLGEGADGRIRALEGEEWIVLLPSHCGGELNADPSVISYREVSP